jgi:hypothetical protein
VSAAIGRRRAVGEHGQQREIVGLDAAGGGLQLGAPERRQGDSPPIARTTASS